MLTALRCDMEFSLTTHLPVIAAITHRIMLEHFRVDLLDEAEAICLRNKAQRRDIAGYGKELQRRAVGKWPGIGSTVNPKVL